VRQTDDVVTLHVRVHGTAQRVRAERGDDDVGAGLVDDVADGDCKGPKEIAVLLLVALLENQRRVQEQAALVEKPGHVWRRDFRVQFSQGSRHHRERSAVLRKVRDAKGDAAGRVAVRRRVEAQQDPLDVFRILDAMKDFKHQLRHRVHAASTIRVGDGVLEVLPVLLVQLLRQRLAPLGPPEV